MKIHPKQHEDNSDLLAKNHDGNNLDIKQNSNFKHYQNSTRSNG